MRKKAKYKVGDKIIESGRVFRIFKIEKAKRQNGEVEKVVHFKPYVKYNKASTLVCSIPYKNIQTACIRKPVSKQKLRKLTRKLTEMKGVQKFPDLNKAKLLLKSSRLEDAVSVIRKLWKEANGKTEILPKSKRDILGSAIDKLTQELALVENISLLKAADKINFLLQTNDMPPLLSL